MAGWPTLTQAMGVQEADRCDVGTGIRLKALASRRSVEAIGVQEADVAMLTQPDKKPRAVTCQTASAPNLAS